MLTFFCVCRSNVALPSPSVLPICPSERVGARIKCIKRVKRIFAQPALALLTPFFLFAHTAAPKRKMLLVRLSMLLLLCGKQENTTRTKTKKRNK